MVIIAWVQRAALLAPSFCQDHLVLCVCSLQALASVIRSLALMSSTIVSLVRSPSSIKAAFPFLLIQKVFLSRSIVFPLETLPVFDQRGWLWFMYLCLILCLPGLRIFDWMNWLWFTPILTLYLCVQACEYWPDVLKPFGGVSILSSCV